MAEVYQRPEPFNVPDGGLATFLTATEGSWADDFEDKYPDVGIGAIKEAADSLAKFGRHEDEYMVHAAEGETVIPKEILDRDPRLKARLFKQMRDMGVDPERYIVGNELNSINPVTGQPEFFLKKFGKFVKRAVKKVVGVLKKAAPIVLSTAINFIAPGLGTAVTGALGAGLGSLVQGKSLKESFNAALLGGAAGALTSGIGSIAKGGTFGEGLAQSINLKNPLEGTSIFGTKSPFASKVPASEQANVLTQAQGKAFEPLERPMDQAPFNEGVSSTPKKNIISRAFDKIMPEPALTTEQIIASPRYEALRAEGFTAKEAIAELSPSIFKRYLPLAAAGTGVMALAGGFKQPPTKDPEGFDTKQYPPLRVGFPLRPGAMPNPYYPGYPYEPPMYEPMQAAKGGEMEFPRRTGGISGPGTGTSDDIPAMLSDGEFVMTAKAVRGAGNGSRKEGVRRMYDMMRTFEGGTA
jgi:hypothetical protein